MIEEIMDNIKNMNPLVHCITNYVTVNNCADDLLYYQNKSIWLSAKHIDNPNIHGNGCTLSSAIAYYLANRK